MGIDRLIVATCVFAGGFILGQINAPEPKVLPCMKKQSLEMSKQTEKRWIAYYRSGAK